jgi:uncharacterized protein YjbI with pentapeptide repeats
MFPESWERLQQVNKTADQLQSYWIGFITIGAFIFASAMSVTHRDIFLESPLKLPIVSVEMPLWWFFFASPLLIFALHVFVLVKYRLLLDSLSQLRALEKCEDKDSGNGHPRDIEQHLNTSILMQSLAGGNRTTATNFVPSNRFTSFFSPILGASLSFLPIGLFLTMQARILPYQEISLDVLFRVLIILDGLIIFWAFSEYWQKSNTRFWLMFLAAAFAVLASTAWMSSDPHRIKTGFWEKQIWFPWSPILAPKNRDFVDNAVLSSEEGRVTTILRNRSFIGARLQYADLRGVDLQNSNFRYAKLLRTRFDGAVLKGSKFDFANLREASFIGAHMDDTTYVGADLGKADFSGADIRRGDFHGANLEQGHFDGSGLKNALLVGTNLRDTRFIGANLKNASLMASYLGNTDFSGAELKNADLTGTIFTGEELRVNVGIGAKNMSRFSGDLNLDPSDIIYNKFRRKLAGLSNRAQQDEYREAIFHFQYCQHPAVRNLEKLEISFKTRAEEIAIIVKDSDPIFTLANLTNVRIDPDKREYFKSNFETKQCLDSDCTRETLELQKEHWEFERSKASNAYKMQLAGCRERMALRIPTNPYHTIVKPKSVENSAKLVNLICFAGNYPHVAGSILASGRFDGDEYGNIARSIIDSRCTLNCPGAEKLDRNSLSRLWRTATKNRSVWRTELPFGAHGMPDAVYDCSFLKKIIYVQKPQSRFQ